MNVKPFLKEFGLTDKESAVYVALLALGDCTLFQLASAAKIKRTTAYPVVDSLAAKGLVGAYRSKKSIRVRPERPETLITRAENLLAEAQRVVPELHQLQQSDQTMPTVTFYRGKKGYQTILEDTLRNYRDTLCFMGNLTELDSIVGDVFDYDYYVPKRVKHSIRIKGLLLSEDLAKMKERDHVRELRELRVLPDGFSFSSIKGMYQNKVAYFSSSKESVCMLIESSAIAEMERESFDFFWEHSIPLNDFSIPHTLIH